MMVYATLIAVETMNDIGKSLERFEDGINCGVPTDCSEYHNELWDSWTVGGRFAGCFLVKESCEDFIIGREKSSSKYIPKGYKAVDGARLSDIEWGVMNKMKVKKHFRMYSKFKEIYEKEKLSDNPCYFIDRNKQCLYLREHIVYFKGESFTEYLESNSCYLDIHYNLPFSYFIDLQKRLYFNENGKKHFHKKINEILNQCDDKLYLVMAECHI